MMSPEDDPAWRYFTPRTPVFWRWAGNNCAEIEGIWDPPTLLAFRNELVPILKMLQFQGWPALSSILLLIAATRESWPLARVQLRSLLDARSPNNPFVADLLEQLDHVHTLPEELRVSTKSKTQLMLTVFEGSRPVLNPELTERGLEILTRVIPKLSPEDWQEHANRDNGDVGVRFADWTRSLRIGIARLTEDALRLRQATGLDDVVVPAPVTVPPPLPVAAKTHAARLWAWSHDPQLYGVARIARRLLSVISWPRRVSQPNDLPLGGFSDLSNRGPLDRLLLSELAQDDDALMVRIALNEAMYLRRECPREQGPHHRAVLIDAGLRMWGRPRVFASAVALAIAAGEDREQGLSVNATVTVPNGVQSADLTTRDGVVQLLSALSPQLHPGDVVGEWQSQVHADDEQTELVLITSPDVFRLPEFQQCLTQLSVNYRLALVDSDGHFELRAHTAHGWRTEQTATLNLDELLEPPANAQSLPLHTGLPDRFPAICRTEPFPLLLTHQLETLRVFPVGGDQLVTLAPGDRVLLWTQSQRGGRQLAMDVPRGQVETWTTTNNSKVTRAVIRAKKWLLLTVNAQDRTYQSVELASSGHPTNPTVRAVILPECVVIISNRGMEAFDLETGVQVARSSYSTKTLLFYGNRYLRDFAGTWFRLSFDGELKLDRVTTARDTLLLLDPPIRSMHSSPLEVPVGGRRDSQPGRVPPFLPTKLDEFCQVGSFLVLAGTFQMLGQRGTHSHPSLAIWDMSKPDGDWLQVPCSARRIQEGVHQQIVKSFHLRNALRTKFSGIRYDGSSVALMTSKGNQCRFSVMNDRLVLLSKKGPAETSTNSQPTISFERLRWPRMSIAWHTATLPNGNTVWLDSRGLLHLVPVDSKQPEISLVLDDGAVTGWVSDGRQFGDHYYLTNFLGGGDLLSPEVAWRTLIAPFFGVPA
jgi:hypothetical protein